MGCVVHMYKRKLLNVAVNTQRTQTERLYFIVLGVDP